MTGVTHTLSSAGAVQALCDLLVAPFEAFDALICTSKAVANMVRSVTGAYADYLEDRFGGKAPLRPKLAVIPLGVNPERFCPPSPQERVAERARVGAAPEEVIVLCVGRLSHHAKAHPYPAFFAAQEAAKRTRQPVCLVFAGWAAHPAVNQAYRDGAAKFAPDVRVVFMNGLDPAVRRGAWHAADVFLSLPDNIQETFGLVVIEAMASGLPVVGSDWDGYRDLIVDGTTGYLVPTRMVRGATEQATIRLLIGQSNYDHFLAECSQATVVDPEQAANALARLVADAALRRRLGAAGRDRVLAQFTWKQVIHAYESLWREQHAELQSWTPPVRRLPGPELYAAPEHSFAGYPTEWLAESVRLVARSGATELLTAFLTMPLTNLAAHRRCNDAQALAGVLERCKAPHEIGAISAFLANTGIEPTEARATIAWMLKYGLLYPCDERPNSKRS